MSQCILLYDGECSFCNRSVQWIISKDPHAKIHFAAQQGAIGQGLLTKYNISSTIDSLIFIEQNQAYIYSDAALHVTKHLHKAWPLLYGLKLVPKFFRDYSYKVFAKHRYQWFGKQQSCLIPTPDIRKRYLD